MVEAEKVLEVTMRLFIRFMVPMAVALSLLPALGTAQTAVTPAPVVASSPAPVVYVPTFEWFAGYSYYRGVHLGDRGNRLAWASGASTSFAINANSYLGLVFDGGFYRATRFGPGAPPSGGVVSARGDMFTLMVGPRVSFRHPRFTPFIQALFGGAYDNRVTLNGCTGFGCAPLPRQSSYTMTAGGGLDITVFRHLAFRLFQIEYQGTRLPNPVTNQRQWQNDARLSTGLVFRFGGDKPVPVAEVRPPLTVACSVDPGTVVAGSGGMVAVHAVSNDAPSDSLLTYSWTAAGGAVVGEGQNVQWNSAGVAPGDATVNGQVANGRGETADCSVAIHIAPAPIVPITPLALSCVVDRNTLVAGDQAQVVATTSPNRDDLVYSWRTSGGQIAGSGAAVSFNSTGLTPGSYTVNGHVADGAGAAADCSVGVDVQAPPAPAPALVARLALHSIYFPTDQPAPNRPDEGLLPSQQAILTTLAADFKTYLALKPDAQLLLEGHADKRGTPAYNRTLTERRVAISKSFLVAQGVPEASINTHSFGEDDQLNAAQVRQQMEDNPNLTAGQRQALFAKLPSIIRAQNRRVDIVLSGTGQQSVRRYPFNAADALTLLSDAALRNQVKGPIKL